MYYALLFAPAEQRAGLAALAAYRQTLLAIPRNVSEAGIGAVKLNWWTEEIERLQRDQPRHPITQALAPVVQTHQLDVQGLSDVIEAARMDLEYGHYPTLRELTLYCHRAGGAIADLAWRLSGAEGVDVAPFAHDLSMGLELTRMIRHLRRDTEAGRLYIPEDEMQAAGLTLETLSDDDQKTARTQLLERQSRRAQQFLDSAIQHLSAPARPNQTYGLVLAVLYRALLKTMTDDGLPVFEQQHHLTPLRKLWLSWRTAKRPQRVQPAPGESRA
ncbi:MAG: squalene/phytoene synthase family protein [Spiribacter sp.]|nr:squalene/phytoene synthase family protein [Spiribacter sp.]MDR9479919.1 squalene/phytoene synthase family protein [Spiribacter sp.]